MSAQNGHFIIEDRFEPENVRFEEEILDFDTILPIESITTAERLQKYPEMYHFRPMRRWKRLEGFPEPTTVISEEIGKNLKNENGEKDRENNNDEQLEEEQKLVNSSICPDCGHWFRSKIVLNTHRHLHREKPNAKIRPLGFQCPIADCEVQCDCQMTLNEHVRMRHQRDELIYETMQFANWVEFERWKENLEHTTTSRFVLTSGRYNNTGKTSRYSCFFSRSTANKPRPLQSTVRHRLSRKLDTACTAYLQIREVFGQIHMRGCLTHCGHEDLIQNLPLSITVKREIAGELVRGMTDDQICQQFRETYPPTDRRFYIRSYEVRNIYQKLMKSQDTEELDVQGLTRDKENTVDERDEEEEEVEVEKVEEEEEEKDDEKKEE